MIPQRDELPHCQRYPRLRDSWEIHGSPTTNPLGSNTLPCSPRKKCNRHKSYTWKRSSGRSNRILFSIKKAAGNKEALCETFCRLTNLSAIPPDTMVVAVVAKDNWNRNVVKVGPTAMPSAFTNLGRTTKMFSVCYEQAKFFSNNPF